MRRVLILFTLASLCITAFLPTAAALPQSPFPTVHAAMQTAYFWIVKLAQPDKVILSNQQIAAYNQSVIRDLPRTVYNVLDYPAVLSHSELQALLNERPFPHENRYLRGQLIQSSFYAELNRIMNAGQIAATNPVHYAFAVRRTDLRAFPTAEIVTKTPKDTEFDRFQETAVLAAEPLLILHGSSDDRWYFVQTGNYRGWVKANDLAVTKDKQKWAAYIRSKQFLVITGNKMQLGYNPYSPAVSRLELGMGTRLALADASQIPELVDHQSPAGNYVVRIPVQGANRELQFHLALIPIYSDVSEGYLPYTRANIIRQAFKMQGERYGWGGMFGARDCSAFVTDIFRSFGIMLPRNADEQETAPGRTLVFGSGQPATARYAALGKMAAGAVLFKEGHVMLYLGEYNGRHYIIHDVSGSGNFSATGSRGSAERKTLNGVMVTDLALPLPGGYSFIDVLTSAKQYE
ncbi:SH3 domain-containing protein [Acetonema longum]|uniref:NLP/P60 protein n=1 Tax=Acetonema longum DSM 6540 TaxID=1009370 RepID=F7NKV3_9FIRM|nr:SH3 domain-containing protein [Acetonema longum]EGO63296.1 NLP/P60 protein [Acetonema longum DSM 6540]